MQMVLLVAVVVIFMASFILADLADGKYRPANRAARKAKQAREKQADKQYKQAWRKIDEASAKGENELLLEHGAEASKETMEKLEHNGFTVEMINAGRWRIRWRAK